MASRVMSGEIWSREIDRYQETEFDMEFLAADLPSTTRCRPFRSGSSPRGGAHGDLFCFLTSFGRVGSGGVTVPVVDLYKNQHHASQKDFSGQARTI